MGSRMNWERAKRKQHIGQGSSPRSVARMEKQADALLAGDDRRHAEAKPERAYFRSVGSVVKSNGRWYAVDGDGKPVADFAERWQAWALADKFGMIRAGMV